MTCGSNAATEAHERPSPLTAAVAAAADDAGATVAATATSTLAGRGCEELAVEDIAVEMVGAGGTGAAPAAASTGTWAALAAGV